MTDSPRFPRPTPPRPVPRWQLLASAVGLFLLAVVVVYLAYGCSGTPSAPSSQLVGTLETQWGEIQVTSQVDGWDDLDALEVHADRGIARISTQGYAVSLDGAIVTVVEDCQVDGIDCSGARSGDVMLVEAGRESALSHELQHLAGHRLGRDGECLRCQDHCGGDAVCETGFDLGCEVC